jgi:hypothetical protein
VPVSETEGAGGMSRVDYRQFEIHDVVEFVSDDDPPLVLNVGSVIDRCPEGITVEWDDGKVGCLVFDWQLRHLRKVQMA